MRSPGLAASLVGFLLLGGALALLRGCGGDSTAQDTRDIEKAYYALRDALLQGDDEAFFAMHGAEAQAWALESFPAIRAGYLAGLPEERAAFQKLYRVTEAEFLGAEPRALVVRMMPWKSGWRERRDFFRGARVKDSGIDYIPLPGGGTERRGVVELQSPDGSETSTVVFVKEKGGWRRRTFFLETAPVPVDPPKKPGG